MIILSALATDLTAADPQLSVALAFAQRKESYVVGEPVRVTVIVTNISRDTQQVWVDVLKEQQIEILIASSNTQDKFREFDRGLRENYDLFPQLEPLKPDHSKHYEFRIFYTFVSPESRKNRLAFQRPGTYLIKARYGPYATEKILESNTLLVQIEPPKKVDAEVWKMIDKPQYLYFLQTGNDFHNHRDVPLGVVKILRNVPKSSYHSALRWALHRDYEHRLIGLTKQEIETSDELRKIRNVLGIQLKPEGPFPGDARLNRPITFHYPQLTPLGRMFEDLSAQSGVPLRLDPALAIRRGKAAPQTKPLREFMHSQAAHKAKWIKDGDGYKLVPDEPEAEAK